MSPETVAAEVTAAMELAQSLEPRTVQSRSGGIGVSDIGGCREKVRLTLEKAPRTNSPGKYQAMLGTAWDEYLTSKLQMIHPDWSFQGEVTITLGEVQILGHYDFWTGSYLVDIKTKNGLSLVRRKTDQQHIWQVTLYLLGLIQAGVVAEKDAVAYLVYFDRSGEESEPHVVEVRYDPAVVDEAVEWLKEVAYALKHGERASKDKPLEFCRTYCEFYRSCRSEDEYIDDGLIEDPDVLHAISVYAEGHQMEVDGKRMKKHARPELVGHAGVTPDGFRLRWVTKHKDDGPYLSISLSKTK